MESQSVFVANLVPSSSGLKIIAVWRAGLDALLFFLSSSGTKARGQYAKGRNRRGGIILSR